ncbi:MAG: hypothetical protein M0C28_26310 [Candidatus Moduliflexus flocculans]|nr:hypothetical protein [Candidatus Moduliflexus flocculans]
MPGYASHPWLAPLIARGRLRPDQRHGRRGQAADRGVHPFLRGQAEARVRPGLGQAGHAPWRCPEGTARGFRVLADLYRGLLADGYRYAYLGNVDNIGYLPRRRRTRGDGAERAPRRPSSSRTGRRSTSRAASS